MLVRVRLKIYIYNGLKGTQSLLFLLGLPFNTKILTVEIAATEETYNFTFFFLQFRFDFVCAIFFLII